jgi:tagatose 1,6-diphosphate aldolase GatY/KbaY
MTDPGEAAEFVERTGVDALAVAVGNVHGLTTTPVSLDLDRLAAIKAAVPVPLVLHGASGLPDQQLGGAIRCGVAKININTELRQAYLAAVQSALPTLLSTHDSVALWSAGPEPVTTAAVRSIHVLSTTSWATLSEPDLGPDPAADRAATSPDRHLRR